jgi:hypothetical protein
MALMPKYDVPLPSSFKIRLSLMPVLLVIHSSVVSTISSKSLFVSLNSGTKPPSAVMAAVVFVIVVSRFNGLAKLADLLFWEQVQNKKQTK